VSRQAIGIFDSGVGGLTVVRALAERLPREELVYLGDTARVPYGSKSPATVTRYAKMSTQFLLDQGVKMVVVACNTASAFAIDELRASLPVPVLGVVEPGARAAVGATRSGQIGVIGTLGTIRSGAYARAIATLDPRCVVASRACPLLVPLAEEGWTDDAIAEAIARRYLGELHADSPSLDVLVLGCTHYPLLRNVIHRVARELWGHEIVLVDSAEAMAVTAGDELQRLALRATDGAGALRCYVTDDARIAEVGARFLGRPMGEVARVDL
jgi:glutamate racemase